MTEIATPTVKEIIAQRVQRQSKPGNREDPYKVGLVVEGGGMRGVIAGGMAIGLEALHMQPALDSMYGNSAGALTALHIAAEQTPQGTSAFYQDLTDKRFINLTRYPVVNIPYMAYEVLGKKKPINWEKANSSPVEMHIYITSALDSEVIDVSSFRDRQHFHDIMHYTARLPVLGGMPIKDGDRYYTDGGAVMSTIPLQAAIDDGCTHILALLTQPAGYKQKEGSLERYALSAILWHRFPALSRSILDYFKRYNAALETIRQAQESGFTGPRIEAIRLLEARGISRLEQNPTVLYTGAKRGFEAIMNKFAPYNLPVDTDILPIR